MAVFRLQKAPIKSVHDCLEKLRYPLYGSYKYDGIRGYSADSIILSNSNKPIRSQQVQEEYARLSGLEGEFIVGNPCGNEVFRTTSSHVTSFDKPADDLAFYVFDDLTQLELPYYRRLLNLQSRIKTIEMPSVKAVLQFNLKTPEEVIALEDKALRLGYEGLMLRDPHAPYREGRATFLDMVIHKMKRSTDDEGVVIGFEERMINLNESVLNEVGLLKKSNTQDAKAPAGMVGKFIVLWHGQLITVAPGQFTHDTLKEIWENQSKYLNRTLKFRYFGYGLKDLPRHPRGIWWRDE